MSTWLLTFARPRFYIKKEFIARLLTLCLLVGPQSVLAETFVGNALKTLSAFADTFFVIEYHPWNPNRFAKHDDGSILIHGMYIGTNFSNLSIEQSFTQAESTLQQHLILSAKPSLGLVGTPIRVLTLLICNREHVWVMHDQPVRADLTHFCQLAESSRLFEQHEGGRAGDWSSVFFSTSRREAWRSQTYELDPTNRVVQLSDEDARQVVKLLFETIDWSLIGNWKYYRDGEVSESVDFEFMRIFDSNGHEVREEVKVLSAFDPEFDPTSDWEGPSIDRIRAELEPTYKLLMNSMNLTSIPEVLRIRRSPPGSTNPRVTRLFENGKTIQLISLNTRAYYFQQYTYQFAHELGHVLTNWEDNPNRKFKWFEETIAEMASAFVISNYAKQAPNQTFTEQAWATYFTTTYTNRLNVTLAEDWNIEVDTKPDVWFAQHRAEMESNPVIRELNWAVARELLPYFMADPSLWIGLSYLAQWDTTANATFEAYLQSWRETLSNQYEDIAVVDLVEDILPLGLESDENRQAAQRPRSIVVTERMYDAFTTLDPSVGNLGESAQN